MEFFRSNKFIIISIIVLSAFGYIFLYIKEGKKGNILVDIDQTPVIETAEEEIKKVYIDISGEIENPGLYTIDEGSRVNDLIILAGGVTKEADLEKVNLAYVLTDGIKLTIPRKNNSLIGIVQTSLFKDTETGMININTASEQELMDLPGIGESTAKAIEEYRRKNGNFKNKEDIKNISGIGDSKYEKMKDKILI